MLITLRVSSVSRLILSRMIKFSFPALTALMIFVLTQGLPVRIAAQKSEPKHPYASTSRISEPTIFAEGVISTGDYESHLSFTPDGSTVYYLLSTPSFNHWTIVVSRFDKGKWGAPEVAPFSGQYDDADPFISRDGSKFWFISNRPVDAKRKTDMDIWVMEKTGDGWGEPNHLGPTVNSTANEWFPTVADDGTLYFGSERNGGAGGADLYRSRLVNGQYTQAENLGNAVNSAGGEYEPFIAHDQSYLIFAAIGRSDGLGAFDLYISYRRDSGWSKAANLGTVINTGAVEFSPSVSPDGKYLFFASTRGFADQPLARKFSYHELKAALHKPRNGLGDIYQIDLEALKLSH